MSSSQQAGPCQIEVRFDRADKTYHEGDVVSGDVFISVTSEFRHDGILISPEGSVNLQLSAKNIGVLEAISAGSVKPLVITAATDIEAYPSGRPHSGSQLKLPFKFTLAAKPNRVLYDTYHGVYIAIQYTVKCLIKRSFPNKDIHKVGEFLVESSDHQNRAVPLEMPFKMSPDVARIRAGAPIDRMPRFLITGSIDSLSCRLGNPFSGHVIVEQSDRPVKSIELQLMRVETVGEGEQVQSEATEIQNIQIADGDVDRGTAIPIYMIFPRLFTCPTTTTPNFKIAFQVNITLIFQDQHMLSETFPISLYRY